MTTTIDNEEQKDYYIPLGAIMAIISIAPGLTAMLNEMEDKRYFDNIQLSYIKLSNDTFDELRHFKQDRAFEGWQKKMTRFILTQESIKSTLKWLKLILWDIPFTTIKRLIFLLSLLVTVLGTEDDNLDGRT